jgi:NAD(P)-dependent dehydrogenase (short-subunit alcohol dehydrogenase family)
MLKLKEVQASNAQLDKSTCPRVAVFVGATSGIGRAAVTKLMIATKDKISLRVYIINRRQSTEASKALVDTLLDLNPAVEVISIAGEVALLAEVQRICDEIKDKESSLDLFYHSAGYAPFGGRDRMPPEILLSLAT